VKDAVKEAATTNRSQTIIMALIAVLGGAGAGTGIQFSPAHKDGDVKQLESKISNLKDDRAGEIKRLEREIADLGELEREVEDLEDQIDDLKTKLREETKDRARIVREVVSNFNREINYLRQSYGYTTSSTVGSEYYMLEAPAAAMEAVIEEPVEPDEEGE